MLPIFFPHSIVRRDWSQLAATTGKEILSKILSDCNSDERVAFIHETLSNIAKDLKNGKVGLADLAITKSLTKDPNDYPDKKSLPHVQVCTFHNSLKIRKVYKFIFRQTEGLLTTHNKCQKWRYLFQIIPKINFHYHFFHYEAQFV